MKKILFLAIALLVAGSVSAQRYFMPHHRINQQDNNDDFYTPSMGVEFGVNISNTVSSNNSNYGTGALAGFNGGLTFNLPIFYPLSFAPEVIYSQKGFVANTTYGDYTQRTQFIDIPLLARFRAGPAFSIYIGPQLSYLISTTNTFNNGFNTSVEQNYNVNGNNKSYLDGVVGVSFDLNRSVDLHARYTIDTQVINTNGSTYVPNYQNQVWQIGLGFKFD
jgi:hypothetical protein